MTRRWLWIALTLGIVGLIGLATTPSKAQSVPLTYGTGVIGKLDTGSPFAFFTFDGALDDQITVRIIGLVEGYVPTVSISSPTGQPLAFNSNDATMPGTGSARVDVRLPMDGAYNVQVGSMNGIQGQFLIRLDGVPAVSSEWISLETNADPTTLTLTSEQPTARLRFNGDEALTQVLRARSNNMPFNVTLHTGRGILRNTANGETPFLGEFLIPAGAQEYNVFISSSAMGDTPVTVTLSSMEELPDRVGEPGSSEDSDPAETFNVENSASVSAADVDCQITTGANGTNLRIGPGTGYSIVSVLDANTTYEAIGRNGTWYALEFDGQVSWVAGSVTFLSDGCEDAPYISPPSPANGGGFASADDGQPAGGAASSAGAGAQPTAVPPQPTQSTGGGGSNPQPTAVPPSAVPPSAVPATRVPPTSVPTSVPPSATPRPLPTVIIATSVPPTATRRPPATATLPAFATPCHGPCEIEPPCPGCEIP